MTKAIVKMKPVQKLMEERGISVGGEVQKYIDSTVLRLSEPYIPLDTSMLARSGPLNTDVGSGNVCYKTPYAGKQYYKGGQPGTSHTGAKRGRLWFERMKADRLEEIINGAKRRTGSK